MDKRSALENLDLIFMTLDELVDGGCVPRSGLRQTCAFVLLRTRCADMAADAFPLRRLRSRALLATLRSRSIILETDPSVVASRVSMRGGDGDVPLSEQTFSQALASAKEQLARSLLS